MLGKDVVFLEDVQTGAIDMLGDSGSSEAMSRQRIHYRHRGPGQVAGVNGVCPFCPHRSIVSQTFSLSPSHSLPPFRFTTCTLRVVAHTRFVGISTGRLIGWHSVQEPGETGLASVLVRLDSRIAPTGRPSRRFGGRKCGRRRVEAKASLKSVTFLPMSGVIRRSLTSSPTMYRCGATDIRCG